MLNVLPLCGLTTEDCVVCSLTLCHGFFYVLGGATTGAQKSFTFSFHSAAVWCVCACVCG